MRPEAAQAGLARHSGANFPLSCLGEDLLGAVSVLAHAPRPEVGP